MYDNLLIDFDAEKMKTEEINCLELPKFEKYNWYFKENKELCKKDYFIVGIDFDEELTEKRRTFFNMSPLKDVLKFGEYIYKNFKKDNNKNPIFSRDDKESMMIAEKLIKIICNKYGIPVTKKNHFEIYDFTFFCYDLYTRFCAWIYITGDDIENAKRYIGDKRDIKGEERLKTKEDIKADIVPVDAWDYNESPVTVHFYYNKETDEYKRIYQCRNLKDLALLQFNLLFFSQDGLVSSEGILIKIKQCEYCGKEFVTTTMQKKYCDNCNKLRQAERKRRSREKAKKNKQ